MKLAVITPTRPNTRNALLEKCRASVAQILPHYAQHIVTEVNGPLELGRFRMQSLDVAPFIAFVDDDDYLLGDSLRWCMEALEATGAGVAFTDEVLINLITGQKMTTRSGVRCYENALSDPASIHHLVVMDTSKVPAAIRAMENLPADAAQWLMHWGTAKVAGAIHVPLDGYAWVMHNHQHHLSDYCRSQHSTLRHELASLVTGRVGEIPQYTCSVK